MIIMKNAFDSLEGLTLSLYFLSQEDRRERRREERKKRKEKRRKKEKKKNCWKRKNIGRKK